MNQVRANDLAALRDLFKYRPKSWKKMGACRGRDTSWWFAEKEEISELGKYIGAKTICREMCPVRWQCLADNIDEPYGIFGGFDREERVAIRTGPGKIITTPVLLQLLHERDAS